MSERCECGTEFTFRRHVRTDKAAPVEVYPDPRGNLRLLPGGRYEVLSGAALEDATEPLYLNHYVNCKTRRRR